MDADPVSPAPPRRGLALRFARDWLAPRWGWFALGGGFSAVMAAAAFAYAAVTERAINWITAGDARVLTLAPLIVIAAAVLRAGALYAQTQANNIGVQRAVVALQGELFTRLMRGDYARLQASASGEYVSQFANDMTVVREASLRVATNLGRSVLTIAAVLAYMLSRDWALTALLVIAYPIAFWPVVKLGDRIRRASKRAQEQAGELTSFLTEAFQGARTVKAYGIEEEQSERARRGFLERARLYMKVLRAKAVVDPFLEALGGLAIAGLFAFAGWRILSGDSTAGELVGFIAAIGVASPEVRGLGTLNSVVNEGLAAADRIYRVIDAADEVVDRPGAQALGPVTGEVRLDHVTFAYPGRPAAVTGLSLTVPAGAFAAIVGPSGAGKSTIFNLLLRLYDPTSGRVLIDGVDIAGASLASVRANIALVSQDAFLFDLPIAENIRFGRPAASDAEVAAAAEAAACDFLAELPGGLQARAGENGRLLSGGQRQRVALARAILSAAPILLLDEATSALDAGSEARVQEAIAGMAGSRTIIAVAHRLATVRRADVILVLDQGRVVETGTHESLLSSPDGVYARLAAQQLL